MPIQPKTSNILFKICYSDAVRAADRWDGLGGRRVREVPRERFNFRGWRVKLGAATIGLDGNGLTGPVSSVLIVFGPNDSLIV